MPTTTEPSELTPLHDVEPARQLELPTGELRNESDKLGADITAEQVGNALQELKDGVEAAVEEIFHRSPNEKLKLPQHEDASLIHELRNGSTLRVADNRTANTNLDLNGQPLYAQPRTGREVGIMQSGRQYRGEVLGPQSLRLRDLNPRISVYPELKFMDDGQVLFFEHGADQRDTQWSSIAKLSPRDAMAIVDAVKLGVAEHMKALDHPDQELEMLPLSPGQTEVTNVVRTEEDEAANARPIRGNVSHNRLVHAAQRAVTARRGYTVYGPYTAKGGQAVDMITPEHFRALPVGTELVNVHTGETVIKGIDDIAAADNDTWRGFIGYGFASRSSEGAQALPYFGPRRTR